MSNFEMAKQYGVEMANLATKGGTLILGLVGSGLKAQEIQLLYEEIDKQTPVKFVKAVKDVALIMERL